jgi:broad specificity phosphatase PhoE
MIKIYLFRHGETDFNKEGRIQCHTDIELNQTGLRQAVENADKLKNKDIEHIYSSPLKRAKKTADVLAKEINVGVEEHKGLMEMYGGELEGKFKTEIINILGKDNYEIFSHTRNEGMDISYPGGETKKQIRDRIVNAICEICESTPYKTIGVSSHGFVLRELIRSTDFEDDSGLDNCEIIEAEYRDGKIKVLSRIK